MIHATVAALAYLLGSIPFSYVVARAFGVPDVREVGSGNVGASNVMRSAGVTAGVLAFVLDALKGTAAVLVASRLDAGASLPPLAALAALLGHVYPVWLGFRGGKGVATGAGAFFPLAPLATAVALGAFLVTVTVSRYISLSSMAGVLALPIATLALGGGVWLTAATAVAALLIVLKHKDNIERLLRGTEARLGGRER